MKIQFLGSGTSTGVPQIGCTCSVCTSKNPKDNRLRASVHLQIDNTNLIIDAGPDFRQQVLPLNLTKIDGILLTHEHYDHVGGLDDVRPFGKVSVFGEENVLGTIRRNMPYCFDVVNYPGVPRINLKEINTDKFKINNTEIQPLRIFHAKLPILGYRIKNVAYLTDVKFIPEETFKLLHELDVLIISALRHQEHFSHANLTESLKFAERINAKQTYFIHMSHDMGLHDETSALLPKNISLSYDGLKLII